MLRLDCRTPVACLLLIAHLGGCDGATPSDSGVVQEPDTPGPNPPESADPTANGLYFASNRGGNYELYTQRGDTLTALTDDPAVDSWWPRQSPDGQQMLFYRSRVDDRPPVGGHNNNYAHASLWSLDLTTGEERELIASDSHGWSAQGVVDWSPDGTRLIMAAIEASSGRWHLYVTQSDGSRPVRISRRTSLYLDPSWSPDGTRIVYAAHPSDYDGTDLARLEIHSAAADGSDETRLTHDLLRDHDPYWSPDGSRIAFETAVDPDYVGVGRWAIRTVDPSGNQLQRVLDDGNVNTLPRWSADGSRLLFHRFVFGSSVGFTLASIATDGGDLQAITNGGLYDDTDIDWLR